MDKIIDPNICGWDTAQYFIFSENVFGDFIYYSHLFPAISSLIISFFVFKNNRKSNAARLLLLMSVIFSFWSFFDLVLWATEKTHYTMFFWSVMIHFDLLLYVISFYFVCAHLYNKLPSWKIDLIALASFIPLALLGHTRLNLAAFDFTNCSREAIEGPLWQFYVYNVELFITAIILIIGIYSIYKGRKEDRTPKSFFLAGILMFLLMFSAGNIAGSLNIDWELGQYGLFGMAILTGILGYLIVAYRTFNVKLVSAQALVVALWILIGSILFVAQSTPTKIVAAITLVLITVFGFMLVRSVKKEVKQREEIESLAENLKRANDQLKVLDKMKSEFVSIASHQLRSPLTSIRGYASMITEGTYGKVPAKAQAIVEKISESAKYMALSIEDYLNVSRIEAGNMKYELTDFNVKEMAEKLVDELRPVALKKGLLMLFRSDCDGSCVVHADIGKTRQVLMNLIDNAMKYTPKGTITVVAHDDIKKKKMYVTIQDTGVGMSEETVGEVFNKFVRAKNANCVNVTGTGLGLYVAKKMIDGMNGRVWAESAGEGKGSSFHIELQLLPGNPSVR